VSYPLGDEWRITNDESMTNDENLGAQAPRQKAPDGVPRGA
jgi:hypothetical protein